MARTEFHLSGSVPKRRRREIAAELRANLRESAEVGGTDHALDQLGDPRALADAYSEPYRHRPNWGAGAAATAAVLVVLELLVLAVRLGFTTGVDVAGGPGGAYDLGVAGLGPFSGSYDPGPSAVFAVTLLTPVHVVAMAVAFLLGSRVWRLVTDRRR